MIIIEVLRSFDRWESLLGEHKWSEFLRSPSEEERGNVSQIFYCTLGTGRHVQKHGELRPRIFQISTCSSSRVRMAKEGRGIGLVPQLDA